MGKTTDIDKIYDHFRKGTDLPEPLMVRFERLSFARDLLFGVGSRHFQNSKILPYIDGEDFQKAGYYLTASDMMKILSQKFNISVSQARIDIMEAKRLFPFLDSFDRDFEKAWLLNSIKKNIARAEEKGDLKTVASEHKNLDTIFGFSRDQGEQQAPTMIINVMNYNPAQLGAKVEDPRVLDEKVQLMLEQDEKRDKEFDEIDWEDLTQ